IDFPISTTGLPYLYVTMDRLPSLHLREAPDTWNRHRWPFGSLPSSHTRNRVRFLPPSFDSVAPTCACSSFFFGPFLPFLLYFMWNGCTSIQSPGWSRPDTCARTT